MKYADVEKSPLVGDGLSTRSGSLLCTRLVVLTSKQLPQCQAILASDTGVCVSHVLVASAPATCGRIRFDLSAFAFGCHVATQSPDGFMTSVTRRSTAKSKYQN